VNDPAEQKIVTHLKNPIYQRNDVLLPHLHALGGETPFSFVEVDFRPLRLAQFARPHEHQRRESQRALRREEAFVGIYRAQQAPMRFGSMVETWCFSFRWRQGAAKIARRIALGLPGSSRVSAD
jgi:hypothetical protein